MVPVYYSWGGTRGEWNEWQTTAVEGLAEHLTRMMQSFIEELEVLTRIINYIGTGQSRNDRYDLQYENNVAEYLC